MSSAGRVGAGWPGAEVTAYAAVNSAQTCADVLLLEPLSLPTDHSAHFIQMESHNMWVLSLSIMLSRFTQNIPRTKTSFPIVPDPYIRNISHFIYQFIS